jgi:cytochrome c oxidase subunit II
MGVFCPSLGLLMAGCSGAPSPLNPQSPGAARIAELGWLMIGLATVVCIIVYAALVAVLRTRPPLDAQTGLRADSDRSEPRADRIVVIAGMVIPVIILAITFGYTVYTLRETAGVAGSGGASFAPHGEHAEFGAPVFGAAGASNLTVAVIGHQWWWQVEYPNAPVVTANEVHVPAGVPVRLTVTSRDVIHSFWIPQIAGKVDLIPGKTNSLMLAAAPLPGQYRGMCGEFCGLQHAHMNLHLVVEPASEFLAWLESQMEPAVEPSSTSADEGQRTFLTRCGECHTVRGVTSGTRGPDLTHLASRARLGAGIHANDRVHLAGWTTDAQAMKPGNKMPSIPMSDAELGGLLDYLEGLK